MNRRVSSISINEPVPVRRSNSYATSVSSNTRRGSQPLNRRLSAISTAEAGNAEPVSSADQAVAEEIAEIKRYEVRSTILPRRRL